MFKIFIFSLWILFCIIVLVCWCLWAGYGHQWRKIKDKAKHYTKIIIIDYVIFASLIFIGTWVVETFLGVK